MKKILAFLLSIALVVTALPSGMITLAEDSASAETSITMQADDSRIHRSQAVNEPSQEGDEYKLGISRNDLWYDYNTRKVIPCIYSLRDMATKIATSNDKAIDRYPYVVTKIDVKAADYYDIGVKINMNSQSAVDSMAIIVDGRLHVVQLAITGEKQTVKAENVYLTAGEHCIVYTSAMPQYKSEFSTGKERSEFDKYYPWTNFWSFSFVNASGKDINDSLEILDASTLTATDVENIFKESTRIEAENTKYVTWNIYSKTEDNASASGGKVVGGVPSYNSSQQTLDDLTNNGLDKTKTPYLQYMVEAPAAGEYYLTVGATVGTSSKTETTNKNNPVPYIAVLVNDNTPVKAQFDDAWGKFDSVTVPVQLQKGVNIIRCTSAIKGQYPEGSSAWVNLDYFEVQTDLIVRPIAVSAEDSDYDAYLYLNVYTDQDTKFGASTYNDLRYDYPSLYEEMFGIYNSTVIYNSSGTKKDRTNMWPYIAFTVYAEQTREYQITAKVGTSSVDNALGIIVDGAMYVTNVTTKSGELTESVYLTAGKHVIIFTSPMPKDSQQSTTYNTHNSAENKAAYTWLDYYYFKVSEGLCFNSAPTDVDIQMAMTNYSRIEAEVEASYNEYYSTTAGVEHTTRYNTGNNSTGSTTIVGAEGLSIDGSVTESEKNVNTLQTYDDIQAGKLDKELTSYIHYVVNADKAGTYVLRVGAYVEGSGTMPYGTIMVNGKVYKAEFTGNWNGYEAVNIPVELKAGINTIQCVGVTADQTDVNGWIGYDYLDIPEGLTACNIEVKVSDSDCDKYLISYNYTKGETQLGNIVRGDMYYDYPSLYEEMLGIYSDVKPDRANKWPYVAFTVYAEQAGEYQISANIGTNADAKTIGMIVDGAMHVIDVTTKSGYLTTSAYLTVGEHVIIFTSPIPRDMESRPTTAGTKTEYPYMDFKSFKLSAGLSFREAPKDADIQTAMTNYLRIEAEGDFATVNGNYNTDISKDYVRKYDSPYTVKVKGVKGAAINGSVSETEKSVNTTQTYTELAAGELDNTKTPYVEYEVTAKKAGNYVIRIGAYVEGEGTMPYGTVLVNGEAYKAQFSGNWNGYDAVNLAVELQAGENIIQCIGVTADQTGTDGWIGYDYLEIPRGLTYHDAGEYTYTSVTSGLSFNKRTTYETEGTITQEPYTISTWIYLPSEYTSRGGVIFGNYSAAGVPCASFEIYENGVPRFFHLNGNGKKVDLEFNKVNVCTDEWTNLTFTISGNKVSCYKNGVHMQTLSPILYNIEMSAVKNPYVLGGDLRQEIATNGTTNVQYFKGRIIDVALYNTALSEEEVLKVYHAEKISAEPYTRYKLENAERDEDVPDTTGNNNLDAKLSYFKEKEAVTDYAYSFAVVGDTQIVTENDVKNQENNLSKIYDWILANKEQKNIQYVFGLGDITDNNTTTEWGHAQNEISRLNGEIPYSLVRGNHDLKDYGKTEDTTADYMTQYLGTDAYKSQFSTNTETGTEGGFYSADDISNSWRTFTVGQVKYLMITLDYGPSDDVLNWAGKIIKEHPEHSVIITTHAYLYRDGTTLDAEDTCPPSTSGGVNNGDDMWNELVSQYENIVLVLSGHDPSDNIVMSRDVGVNGNVVTSMLIDPQGVDYEDGSTGMLAMLYFSADGTKVQVEYFSTVKEAYFKEENQFNFELTDCGRQVKEYTAQQVIDFKTQGTYPKDVEGLEDYLFAGWYTDRACDEASLLKDATPPGTTYALFVPKHVLSVKAQISTNLLDSNTENDSAASIRFVTTVDTLLYKKAGFKISYTDANGQKQEFESASGTVYQKLYAVNSESKIDTITPNKYFCGLSAYFKACTITGIPKNYYNTEFKVTPFWITMDGATVYGDTVTKTVNMGISKW